MRKKPPCHKCRDRYSGCHSVCEKYRTYKQELDEERAAAFQERCYLNDYMAVAARKHRG